MRFFLLGIGDELLDGRVQNTNATYFSTLLTQDGHTVSQVRAIGDDKQTIIETLQNIAGAHDVVIVTGGLGPTNDDITAEAAARAFAVKFVESNVAKQQIQTMLKKRGSQITKARLGMAKVPEGAKIYRNFHGVAPAFEFRYQGTRFFFLQGVPRECRPIFLEHILPKFRNRSKAGRIYYAVWRTFGQKEADIHLLLKKTIQRVSKKYPGTVKFGFQIPWPGVDVRFEVWRTSSSCKVPTPTEAKRIEAEIDAALADITYTRADESMAETVMRLLKEKKKTIALAESCTGGLVSKLLTDIPGSSTQFIGSAVSYANSAKSVLAQVPPALIRRHGAVSQQVAVAMAQGIRDKLQTDYALSLTGISGPSGGSKQKPVGTIYVGLADRFGTHCVHQASKSAQNNRALHRDYAAYLALNMLRLALKNADV